jgi:voltage-gated potassium channel
MKKTMRNSRPKRFIKDIATHTPFAKMIFLLVILWFAFSTGLYFTEVGAEGATITSYGDALYWGIAAFSTAGIADTPQSDIAQLIGAIWIVVGSVIFFGTIVATVTTYFMRPMQRPARKIIDTIEYNLEQLNDLTIDELDLLKETVDTLIIHVERLKKKQQKKKKRSNDQEYVI